MHLFRIRRHAVVHLSQEGRPLDLRLVRSGAHTKILRQDEEYEDHELVLDAVRLHNNSNPESTPGMAKLVQAGWVIFQREGQPQFTVAWHEDVETL